MIAKLERTQSTSTQNKDLTPPPPLQKNKKTQKQQQQQQQQNNRSNTKQWINNSEASFVSALECNCNVINYIGQSN